MNILLLGNGFDIHHKFPTRYMDFLHTVHFLIQNKDMKFHTVGDVFSNVLLQEIDPFIRTAYEKHCEIYNSAELNQNVLSELISTAGNNTWFAYLYNTLNRDIGWIDFEKEIVKVLSAFEMFFNPEEDAETFKRTGNRVYFDLAEHPCNSQAGFIIDYFKFFYTPEQSPAAGLSRMKLRFILPDYYIEDPIGSKYYLINTEKISSGLYDSLTELSKILAAYLKIFVDTPSNIMRQKGIASSCASYPTNGHVFTFNYTNTFEYLYSATGVVEHIHGNVDTDIVLGVNPDEKDELYEIDTTFLQFKKYFQRIFLGTDVTYINKVQNLVSTKKYDNGYSLYVIGHSLDATDKDIIKELFELANRIIILYHNKSAVKGYIKNLVEIYGKKEFDRIRAAKNLHFLQQAELDWNTTT